MRMQRCFTCGTNAARATRLSACCRRVVGRVHCGCTAVRCCAAPHSVHHGSAVPRLPSHLLLPPRSLHECLQSLELQVHSLQEKVSALQAAAEARARHRRWLPELPETVGTRQALLGAVLLASASAAAALLYSGRQQALAAR